MPIDRHATLEQGQADNAQTLAGRIHDAFAAALAQGATRSSRLGQFCSSASVSVTGAGAIDLLLDHGAVRWSQGDAVDATIHLTPEQAERLIARDFALVPAIVRGEVDWDGAIRDFLAVAPIVQSLLGVRRPNGEAPPSPDRASLNRPVASDIASLEARGLRKSFGPHRVLDGLDLSIPEGTIAVILGPSGTGKSVFLKHIIGALREDAGDILVGGRSLNAMGRAARRDLQRDIGVMFQDGALFSALNVFDNVAFPLRQHTVLKEREIRDVVVERLAAVGLSGAAARLPNELSGGMRKRAGLARALVLEPRLVLCDEPDSGLDPVRTALLGELLVDQHAEHGGTMVVVTHNVALARQISDYVTVLWRGQVVARGLTPDVLASDDEFIRQFLRGETAGPLGMDA
jgi:phospholipid/cholesterol/gamma-HCH transport system ATP-binding protein